MNRTCDNGNGDIGDGGVGGGGRGGLVISYVMYTYVYVLSQFILLALREHLMKVVCILLTEQNANEQVQKSNALIRSNFQVSSKSVFECSFQMPHRSP